MITSQGHHKVPVGVAVHHGDISDSRFSGSYVRHVQPSFGSVRWLTKAGILLLPVLRAYCEKIRKCPVYKYITACEEQNNLVTYFTCLG